MAQLPRTEKSLWREAYPDQSYPQLLENLETDVAVVGAGITGLTAAYLLKRRGYTVAVLEKDTVCGGTSGRTTGKVTSQHGVTYADLQTRLGVQTARAYGTANQAAVEQVASIIQAENIDCDWQRDDNYVFTADPALTRSFKQEASVAAGLGLPATFETDTPLPFAVQAAVKFAGQGKFHSQRYLLGLAGAVNGAGSYVFERSKVTGIRDGNPCRIRTPKARIMAKDVIVATNVPTLPLVARGGYCALEYPTESFILAGRLDKPFGGMYISPDKHHYSILPIAIGSEHFVVIAGAGGNLPGFRVNKVSRHRRLAAYAEKHFGVTNVNHRWSDRDYIAYDSVPLIGKLYPWSTHVYVGSAYRKWGLSNGTAAGMILSDLISGRENPWAPYFTPQRRTPITSFPRAVARHIKG